MSDAVELLSLAVGDPISIETVMVMHVDDHGPRVWWASFGEEMAVMRDEDARRRRLDRYIQLCPEAVLSMA